MDPQEANDGHATWFQVIDVLKLIKTFYTPLLITDNKWHSKNDEMRPLHL